MHRNTRAADADGVGTAVYWGNDSLSGKQLSELLGRPAGGGGGARTPLGRPHPHGGLGGGHRRLHGNVAARVQGRPLTLSLVSVGLSSGAGGGRRCS